MKQIILKLGIALVIISSGASCFSQAPIVPPVVPPVSVPDPDPDFALHNSSVHRTGQVTQGISGNSEAFISLYPNPVKEKLNIQFNHFPAGDKAQLLIVSSNGMNYSSEEINFSDGVFTMEIDVSRLPAGIYSLQVISPSLFITRNFLKG